MITDLQLQTTYYQALLNRDATFAGVFFAAVTTTSIFCISTCRARKPKPEHVIFYASMREALAGGYRPCKICRPTEHAHAAPPAVQAAIRLVEAHPKEKITDTHLRDAGIGPETLRRWFKQHYGLTFHAYQRMYRINLAVQELKSGKSATETAFDTGYESLSGFGYTYKSLLGSSPRQGRAQAVILIHRFTTPLGPMFACATEQGLCLLEFTDRRMLETEFSDLQRRLQARILTGENDPIRQAKEQLAAYFAGERHTFDVPLHTPGTDFQQQVWQRLREIPYGETVSYQTQAQLLGRPMAVRAVASANGHNRIAIIIPCHRVIGKDGNLTGYGGGLARKAWLLDWERQHRPMPAE
ncbi:MAG: methylated-DNA--[protein]-cysteine S-methyltransferase [Bacteroidia bacterium]